MEKVKLDNKRILFNLLPAHVAQHFLMSNPRNMVRVPGGGGGVRCASAVSGEVMERCSLLPHSSRWQLGCDVSV